jgi:hypothetical protein
MMLNDTEDLDNYERKQFPNPTYMQRSVSAPAIAEHVSRLFTGSGGHGF